MEHDPRNERRRGITLTWVVTGPMLAFAIFGPAAGKLAGGSNQQVRHGRRSMVSSAGQKALHLDCTCFDRRGEALDAHE